MYTHTLTATELAMFRADNQLTFTVTQLIDNTPFGLAFDIQLVENSDPAPEPGTLGLVGAILIAGWARLRRTGWRPQGRFEPDSACANRDRSHR
jgi:hypothetical protein